MTAGPKSPTANQPSIPFETPLGHRLGGASFARQHAHHASHRRTATSRHRHQAPNSRRGRQLHQSKPRRSNATPLDPANEARTQRHARGGRAAHRVIPAQAGIHSGTQRHARDMGAAAYAPFVPDERGANAVSGVCPGRRGARPQIATPNTKIPKIPQIPGPDYPPTICRIMRRSPNYRPHRHHRPHRHARPPYRN